MTVDDLKDKLDRMVEHADKLRAEDLDTAERFARLLEIALHKRVLYLGDEPVCVVAVGCDGKVDLAKAGGTRNGEKIADVDPERLRP